EKNEDDQDDQADGDDQGAFHIVNGSADGDGAVDGDVQMEGGRNGGAQLGNDGLDAVDGIDHVRARLAEHGEDDGRLAIGKAEVADVVDGIADVADVAQADRGARTTCNDERLIFVSLEQLVGVGDGPGVGGVGDCAFGEVGVRGLQSLANGFERNAVTV